MGPGARGDGAVGRDRADDPAGVLRAAGLARGVGVLYCMREASAMNGYIAAVIVLLILVSMVAHAAQIVAWVRAARQRRREDGEE